MSAAAQVVHPVLASSPAALPLAEARLTDRQRLSVVLEGAGLLSLLERAGWWLPRGWEPARVAADGRLLVPPAAAAPGRSPRPAQEQLRELLLRLFGVAAGAAGPAAAGSSGPEPGEAAPGTGLLAGRGEARKAGRALLVEWWQPLVPVPADAAVGQVLALAPFLWLPAFAVARQSLAGELLSPAGDRLWVAGPSASRTRLLAGCRGADELAARLGGALARTWWDGETPPAAAGTAAPGVPAAEGAQAAGGAQDAGGTQAVEAVPAVEGTRAAEGAPAAGALPEAPTTEAARLGLALASASLGRFAAALAILVPCRAPAARLLRARCQVQLGRLGAARATLRRLEALRLTPEVAIEAAELAVRVFANSGEPDHVPRWVRRALAAAKAATAPDRARAALVAAAAAWDRQEPAAMEPYLEAARAALFDGGGGPAPDQAGDAFVQALWRWHHARGMQATAAFDGAAVVEHLRRALGCGRRRLARHEAAGLWNDLGIGRVQSDDLAGAERAFLHAQRLLGGCEGPRRATLALHNLAEVRLRRGRTAGVREILARSTAENRRAGNLRGLTQDTELWARLELVLGRPAEAAALCRAAIERLGRRRSRWRREVLAVLLARALGWLERPSAAAAELALAGGGAVAELEAEERPALWAHAGEPAAARCAAASLELPLRRLWLAVLDGGPVPGDSWEALAGLEPYRAARLLFDLERAAAGGLEGSRRLAAAGDRGAAPGRRRQPRGMAGASRRWTLAGPRRLRRPAGGRPGGNRRPAAERRRSPGENLVDTGRRGARDACRRRPGGRCSPRARCRPAGRTPGAALPETRAGAHLLLRPGSPRSGGRRRRGGCFRDWGRRFRSARDRPLLGGGRASSVGSGGFPPGRLAGRHQPGRLEPRLAGRRGAARSGRDG